MLTSFLFLTTSLPAHAEDEASAPEEIVVEAERKEGREAWDTPAAVTVFEIDETLSPGVDLGALVDRAPGVQLRRLGDADDFQGVSIRGSSMRQVTVYLDGIPLNPEGSRAINLSEWPVRALKRVELYRGYAPASLGGAAIGGAIDLVTRDDPTPLSGGISASRYGQVRADTFTSHVIQSQQVRQDATLFTEGHVAEGAFPYFTDNGTPYARLDDGIRTRTNNASTQGNVLGRYRADLGTTRLTLIDAYLNRLEGLPGHINNPTSAATLHTQRNLVGVQAKRIQGHHLLTATSWWSHRNEVYDDRADELGLGAQWQEQVSNNLGVRLHDQWFLTQNTDLGFTASTRAESASSTDLNQENEMSQHDRAVDTATLYARFDYARFGAESALQATQVRYPSRQTQGDHSLDPRIAVLWRWGERTLLRATAGRYLRPPDLDETFGDRGSMIGNPDLRPERGWQWDVGMRSKWAPIQGLRLRTELSHFWNAGTDQITWVQNSQKTMMPVNFGHTWIQGLEGSLVAMSEMGLESDTSVTHTRSTNLDSDPAVANKQLPSIPTWSIWEEVSYTGDQDALRLAYSFRYVAGNFVDATNWFRSAPRSIHGISIQYQPKKRWPRLEAGVANLFDKQAEVVAQNPLQPANSERIVQPLTDLAGYPLPGRTWTLSLRWSPWSTS